MCNDKGLRKSPQAPRSFQRNDSSEPMAAGQKKSAQGAQYSGGAKGIRTPDLLNAIQTRYQLRYNPVSKSILQEIPQKNQVILCPKA